VNIDLAQILYKIAMIILAFLVAIMVTKTFSKYMRWDEKMKKNEEPEEHSRSDD